MSLVATVLTISCGRKGPDAPPDTTPPFVTASTPAVGAINVGINLSPSATFSEAVDQSTITFTLNDGTTTMPCTMSYNGKEAVFTLTGPLSYSTLYTATVSAGVKDLAGNFMTNDYFWSFITRAASNDTTPPSVSATTPTNGASHAVPNAALSATFREPVDQSTITFTLSAGGVPVPTTMSYAGTTAIFTPADVLAYNTKYTAAVSAGVKDLAGNLMPSDYTWTFTTGSALDTTPPFVTARTPAAGATNVNINLWPSVTFNEAVDQSTITFTLNDGSTTIPCTMSYSGKKAVFTPAGPLSYSTQYTATVSAGVKDLAGNAMPSDYTWTFTTEQR